MSLKHQMMAHGLLLVLLYLGNLAITLADEDTVIYDFSVTERDVHKMILFWNISEEYEVDFYSVKHQKKDSQVITYSGTLYNASEGYVINDLVPNTEYDVCLTITLLDSDQCEKSEGSCIKCLPMSTIPVIRDDSLIAVILTLGMILLLVLIGYVCWHYAKKKMEGDDDEECSEHGSDESKQPILLAVPSGNGPRRSVDFEDQDIPYIDEVNRHGEQITKDSTATHV